MIKIRTVGSSSSGNCYIIECTTEEGFVEKLILEAGIRFKTVQKALNYDLSGISGCCISHCHGDHAGFAAQMAEKRIVMYSTQGTIDAIKRTKADIRYVYMTKKTPYNIGLFRVMAFETEHDAPDPCGFLIDCPDGNRIVFATDTYYLKYNFPNVTIFMMECNYDEETLQQNIKMGIVHPSVGERVRRSHMSIRQCITTLKANDLSRTKGIILIHLSHDNSHVEDFKRRVQEATGRMVYVATPNSVATFF